MYDNIVITKELARQFALEIYDQLMLDIKKETETEKREEIILWKPKKQKATVQMNKTANN